MTNTVVDYSNTIIDIFKDVTIRYESNLQIIKQTEDEINDINHEIELSSPKDMYHGYLLYKTLRELRVRRRQAKDENDIIYINNSRLKKMMVSLKKIYGEPDETIFEKDRR